MADWLIYFWVLVAGMLLGLVFKNRRRDDGYYEHQIAVVESNAARYAFMMQDNVDKLARHQAFEDKLWLEFYRKQGRMFDAWAEYIKALRSAYPDIYFFDSMPFMEIAMHMAHARLITEKPLYLKVDRPPRLTTLRERAIRMGWIDKFPLINPMDFEPKEEDSAGGLRVRLTEFDWDTLSPLKTKD